VFADRGYFRGEEILNCYSANITAYVPKPMTSSAKAVGRFNKDVPMALCVGEGESVKPPACSSAENKKTAEAGFFKTIPTSCR
jgi:hypothetical protein